MSEKGRERLQALLFNGNEDLVNVKLFPGNAAHLTDDVLADAAERMLRCARDAFNAGEPSNPPTTGMVKRQFVA